MACIDARKKDSCCGCGACVSVCPQSCVSMMPDDEGFDYPAIDPARCTSCGRCRHVCPFVDLPNTAGPCLPLSAFASWHLDDDIRRDSSSGGVFSALAEHTVTHGGVVFGAAFDDDFRRVRHIGVRTSAELARLRGSKYVQSRTVDAFPGVCRELDSGRRVLFVGTPCQVAGLRKLVGWNDSKLLTCDFVCHGVPSPGVFAKYMEEQSRIFQAPTVAYSFRDKGQGWNFPQIQHRFSNRRARTVWAWGDPFMHGFLLNVFLRPVCYVCPFASVRRVADITLGDYWGVATQYPQYDDNGGTSLVLINTAAGMTLFDECARKVFAAPCDLDHAASHNGHLVRPAGMPLLRGAFFDASERLPFSSAARVYIRKSTLLKRWCTRSSRRLLWWARSLLFRFWR
jgi:coenzyme F420-reducing hydrogenase beta subunit